MKSAIVKPRIKKTKSAVVQPRKTTKQLIFIIKSALVKPRKKYIKKRKTIKNIKIYVIIKSVVVKARNKQTTTKI